MHYYKRNIGDYHKKAGRLTMLQHGAYTLLMDACYDREKFPTKEDAIEWLWANSPEEIAAIDFVLKKFFTEINGVFVQHRIESELNNYAKNAETNKRIALEREEKRRLKSTKRAQSVDESSTERHLTKNQEPLTTNQELETIKKTSRFTPPSLQDVMQYCKERKNFVDAQNFIDHYSANGWMRGKAKIKDWKACVRTWEKNSQQPTQPQERKRPRAFGE